MFHSIINEYDILYSTVNYNFDFAQKCRSSNPFDFIQNGYSIDNASLFGGQNNVIYNINIPRNVSVNNRNISNI